MSEALPHNMEAEHALIGALIIKPELVAQVSSTITPYDFYDRRCAALYRAILDLASHGWPADSITIVHALKQSLTRGANGEIEHEAAIFIGKILDSPPVASNATYYGEIVKEMAVKRGLVKFAIEMREAATENNDPSTLMTLIDGYVKTVKARALDSKRAITAIDMTTVLEAVERQQVPWLIQGWLAENEMAYLAGEWGSGKSYVGLDAAVSLAAGIPWLNKVHVPGPISVLYVDEENGPALARHRAGLICRGRGLSPEEVASLPIRYLARNGLCLDDAQSYATIEREIESTRAQVVVLDSLVRFFRGRNENDASDMAAFFSDRLRPLIAKYGISILALDHMGKPSKERTDPGHRMRGSSEKPANADEVWAVEGDRASDRRTLSHQKTRWDDLSDPLSLRWIKSEDGLSGRIECSEERQGCEAHVAREAVLAAGAGLYHADLCDAVARHGWHEKTIRRAIGKLHGQGTLRRQKAGAKRVMYWHRDYAPEGAE